MTKQDNKERSQKKIPKTGKKAQTQSSHDIDVALIFAREFYNYQSIQSHICNEMNRRCQAATRDFNVEIDKRLNDVNTKITKAYEAYSSAFHREAANPDDESSEDTSKAYEVYVETFHQAQTDMQDSNSQLHQSYSEKLAAIQSETSDWSKEVFRDFVDTIKQSWADINPDSMNSAKLASIAQSTFAAAVSLPVS